MDKLEDALRWIVSILEKHHAPFQISGGFAAHLYGANRPVNDIDIDTPGSVIDAILSDIKPYVIYGPVHHKNNRWDLKLVTLNYRGQEIDISSSDAIKIHDDRVGVWKDFSMDLKNVIMLDAYGIKLPVIPPKELAEYKKLLSGDHQKVDIEAVERFVIGHKD